MGQRACHTWLSVLDCMLDASGSRWIKNECFVAVLSAWRLCGDWIVKRHGTLQLSMCMSTSASGMGAVRVGCVGKFRWVGLPGVEALIGEREAGSQRS